MKSASRIATEVVVKPAGLMMSPAAFLARGVQFGGGGFGQSVALGVEVDVLDTVHAHRLKGS